MRICILLILLWSCAATGQETQEAEAVRDSLTVWLQPGDYTAFLMNGTTSGARADELSKKMNNALQENQEWYMNFVKKIPDSEVMPYHKNLGLTEAEYDELLELMDDIQPAATSEGTIEVTSSGGKLAFAASGQLQALNIIEFDKASNSFYFYGEGESSPPLRLHESIDVSTGKSGPYSKWHGYEWRYAEGMPTDEELEKLKDFSDLSFSEYTVTVGKSHSGEVILNVEIKMMHQGQMVANNKLPVLIK